MGTRIVDLLALGIVNGGYDGTSEGSRGDRTRDNTFIPINNGGGVQTLSITITITSRLGKTVQVNMYGYNTTPGVSPIIDWYWYNSGSTFNAQSYTSTLHYIRCQYQYSDRSSFDASEITSATATIEELDTRWWLDENNRLTRTELPQYSTDELMSPPLPATFWRLDSDNILTLNSNDWSPLIDPIDEILTPPYPASFWWLNENDILANGLLPNPINSATLVEPYPASFWWYDTSQARLREVLQPAAIPIGAFVNCRNLTYIKIPSTVTKIGREAFYNSGLTLVRIPAGCIYYPTSFPPGCEIQTYSV